MELLLFALITCSEGKWILDGIASTELSSGEQSELSVEIIKSMPTDCSKGDYLGESTR